MKRSKEKIKEAEWRRRKWQVAERSVTAKSGLWLRQWRRDHNLAQREVAAALGVSLRTIMRWESWEEIPRLVALALEGK